MHINVISTSDQWAGMAPEWNQLVEHSATNVPFLRHEYLTAWWAHKGGGEWPEDSQLYIITGRDDAGELKGIAPLFSAANGADRQALLLLGSIEISDFLDLIARPEDLPTFCEALLAHLTGPDAPAWNCMDLNNILESSPSLAALQAAAEKHSLGYNLERLQPAPYIELPGDFEDYLESLDGKERQELRRKMRNAARYFIPVKDHLVTDGSTLDEEFESFAAMMVQEQGKEEFLTPAMKTQMHAIVQAAFEAGYLYMRFLTIGKDKAAVILCFDYDNRLWGYNSGLERRYQQVAPGAVLLSYTLMDAISKGRAVFDFMRGDEDYKYRYGAVDRSVLRVLIERN